MSAKKQSIPVPRSSALAALFGQSPIPIEYYNAQGKWEAGNAAALETFGIISEETVGFDIFKDEAIPAGLRAALKRGEAIRFRTEFDFSKVTYKTVRNDVANFEFYITPLRDRAGDTIGIMVQTIDLTDTK
jgi:PAS domain S-box-containing protein